MKLGKGFTLVEVLLVVLILDVLASVVIPRIAGSAVFTFRMVLPFVPMVMPTFIPRPRPQ